MSNVVASGVDACSYVYKGSKKALRKYIDYRADVEVREGLSIGIYEERLRKRSKINQLNVITVRIKILESKKLRLHFSEHTKRR